MQEKNANELNGIQRGYVDEEIKNWMMCKCRNG